MPALRWEEGRALGGSLACRAKRGLASTFGMSTTARASAHFSGRAIHTHLGSNMLAVHRSSWPSPNPQCPSGHTCKSRQQFLDGGLGLRHSTPQPGRDCRRWLPAVVAGARLTLENDGVQVAPFLGLLAQLPQDICVVDWWGHDDL